MWIPPIIERELRIAMRKHGAVKSRFRIAAYGVAGVGVMLFFQWLAGGRFSGVLMHHLLLYCGLYLAVIPAAYISVGLFCEERRNQTLELLYLTGMGAGELFLGKLLGGILIASSDLLALAPFFAVPFMMGGLSRDLFLATVACFPVLFLFTVAVGTLASVLCEDDGAALASAVVMTALFCLATPLPYYLGQVAMGGAPFSAKWLCLSPAFGPFLTATNFRGFSARYFWLDAGITLALALVILILAALILNRNWRQRIVVRSAAPGWRGKWEAWVHGSAAWRAALRERLLLVNPFQWLAQQDRRPVVVAWGFIAGLVVLWLLGWLAWPHAWPSPMNFYITALILVLGVDSIMTYAAARRIGLDRRDGSLELLLTTPLDPAEIVDGQLAAVRAQFRPVRLTMLGLCTLMMAGGWLSRGWTVAAEVSYVVIWGFFFGWILYQRNGRYSMAMWVALNSGRPIFAVFRLPRPGKRWASHWYWFYWLYNSRNLFRGLIHASSFPSGSPVELVVVCFSALICLILTGLIHAAPGQLNTPEMRYPLIKTMRSIAREPVPESNDSRFKNWNVRERFPARPK